MSFGCLVPTAWVAMQADLKIRGFQSGHLFKIKDGKKVIWNSQANIHCSYISVSTVKPILRGHPREGQKLAA